MLLPLFVSYSIEELRGLDTEKEEKDRSSPKGVIEACFEGLESNITSDESSPKAEIRCVHSGALSNWRKFFKLWKRRSIKRLASFPPLAVPKLSEKNSRSTKENPMLRDLYNFKSSLENFSLPELRAATDNFNAGMQLIGLRILAKTVCIHLVHLCSRIWQNHYSLFPLLTMRKYEVI